MNEAILKQRAEKLAAKLNALGFAKNGKPMVVDQAYELVAAEEGFRNQHALRAALKKTAQADAPSLVLEADAGDADNFVLQPGRKAWITVDGIAVSVYRTDEGVVVDLFAAGAEDCESIGSTYAFWSDAEAKIAGDVDLDDVGEWVGLHYGRNFDAESPVDRLDWIRRYTEVNGPTPPDVPAAADSFAAKRAVLEKMGYSIAYSDFKLPYWQYEDEASEDFVSEETAWMDAWRDLMAENGLTSVIAIPAPTPMQQAMAALEKRWGHEHVDYNRKAWGQAAANGDTQLGYWEWVVHQLESTEFDS